MPAVVCFGITTRNPLNANPETDRVANLDAPYSVRKIIQALVDKSEGFWAAH
jgi:hypothetical protein